MKLVSIRLIVGACVLAALVGIGVIAYRSYQHRLSAQAHDVFAARYAVYEQSVADQATHKEGKQIADDQLACEALSQAVSRDYQVYKNSAYAPFFLALQAELEAARGNNHEALVLLTKAVGQMGAVDPVLYYTYATKLALMQRDAAEPTLQTKGRQALETLAQNKRNPMRDMASFYTGYQAMLEHDTQGMQHAWRHLFDMHNNPLSIWGLRAQSFLNYTA